MPYFLSATAINLAASARDTDLLDHWGEEKANILIHLGLSEGTGGNKWEPNKSVSRAEAAKFIF
ncbi:S-layer homology domain-containing protein [Bacillus sp. B-TM1]